MFFRCVLLEVRPRNDCMTFYKDVTLWKKTFWNKQYKYVQCNSLQGTKMQQVGCFNIQELTASSTLPTALLHPSDEQQVAEAMVECWWHYPRHTKGCHNIAYSHSMPKVVQCVQIGTHPRSLKLEPIKNFNFHIRPQHPKTGKDLLLSFFWNIYNADQCYEPNGSKHSLSLICS